MNHRWLVNLFLGATAFVVLLITILAYQIPTPSPIVKFEPTPTSIPTPTPLPVSNVVLSSSTSISGKIDRSWVFEGSFPFEIIDSQGKIILEGIGSSPDWSDGDSFYVDFVINFKLTSKVNNGFLIVRNDNPSGLPQNNKSYKTPLTFLSTDQISIKIYDHDNVADPESLDCLKNSYKTIQISKTSTPLKDAINQLLKQFVLDYGKDYGDSVVNFKLISATIVNGEARLVFDDPGNFTSGGSCRINSIYSRIEDMAKQFPTVKSVKVTGAIFQP